MKFRSLPLFLAIIFSCGAARPAEAAQAAALTLSQALERAFARNPELVISELEIKAASARVAQAGVKPNPEIAAEAENVSLPGSGGLLRYTESTLQVNQRLELGGKRDLRVRAAKKEVTVASSQLELKKAELILAVSKTFAEVLSGQERLTNHRELSRLARQSHAIVVERVAAGKVSPVEQTRASVVLASAILEEEKRRQALAAAKDRLAALWGGSGLEIQEAQGRFEIPAAIKEIMESCLQDNPEMKLAAAATDFRSAALELELANRKPDVTFSAGFRRLNLDNVQALVAGVSIPLPLFDKRQGAIAEARIRLEQSQSEQTATQWRLRSALVQARHEHETALQEATALRETALPAAREAAAAVEEGYRLGKFDFIDVLDAQRTLAELQGRTIEAVASGMRAAIEIDRLARCNPLPPAK